MLEQDWTIERGYPWKRIVVPQDRRTRRKLSPTTADAAIATDAYSVQEIACEIAADGAIRLTLDADTTRDLVDGRYPWDVVATIDGVKRPIAKGYVTVVTVETVTRGDEDITAMILDFDQREDFTRTVTWRNEDGTVSVVTDAFMQAKDGAVTVLDLRWFVTPPSEVAIAALPAAQRGYLTSGAPDSTLVIHVSNLNPIAAGSYPFDLFVKDADGQWGKMFEGTVQVGPSVSEPPV